MKTSEEQQFVQFCFNFSQFVLLVKSWWPVAHNVVRLVITFIYPASTRNARKAVSVLKVRYFKVSGV